MNNDSIQFEAQASASVRSYVLGRLSEEEQEAFELRYFGDPALLEQAQSLRDELLDEYLSGALEPAEHELLTARLARSAVWRDKAAALQTLRDLACELSPPTSTLGVPPPDVEVDPFAPDPTRFWHSWFGFISPIRWAALATCLALLGLGAWLISKGDQKSAPTIALNATPTPQEPVSSAPPAVTVTPAAAKAKPQIATFSLALNLTRQTEEAAVLNLKAGTSQIELQLDLGSATDEAAAAFYQVSLHNAADQRIWQNPRAAVRRRQDRRVLLLTLAAQLVTAGRYELRLRADQPTVTAVTAAAEATLPFTVQIH